MTIFDGLILAILCGGIWRGHVRGFAEQVAGIITLVVGFGLATSISRLEPVANAIQHLFGVEEVLAIVLAWAAIYFVVCLILTLLIRSYHETLEEMHVAWLDKNLGGILGGLKALLLCLGVTLIVTGAIDRARDYVLETSAGRLLAKTATVVEGVLPSPLHTRFQRYLDGLDRSQPAGPEAEPQPTQPLPLVDPTAAPIPIPVPTSPRAVDTSHGGPAAIPTRPGPGPGVGVVGGDGPIPEPPPDPVDRRKSGPTTDPIPLPPSPSEAESNGEGDHLPSWPPRARAEARDRHRR